MSGPPDLVSRLTTPGRTVPAVHGRRVVTPDAPEDLALVAQWRRERTQADLLALAAAHAWGDTPEDARMRRLAWGALLKRCGHGLRVGRGAIVRHPGAIEIGDGVLIGDLVCLHARAEGRCVIGAGVWIGPQAFVDAWDFEMGEYAALGPGARVLGSEHTGLPADVPLIATDLTVRPVRVEAGADVGMNAVLLPGVIIGRDAVVGAGSVVTGLVPPRAIVAGVPARLVRLREGAPLS